MLNGTGSGKYTQLESRHVNMASTHITNASLLQTCQSNSVQSRSDEIGCVQGSMAVDSLDHTKMMLLEIYIQKENAILTIKL